MNRKCENCKYFRTDGNTCKRYPRTPVAHQNASKKWIVSFLNPQTSPEDYCGEHVPAQPLDVSEQGS